MGRLKIGSIIMQHINIIFNDGIQCGGVEILSLGQSMASSESEAAGSSDDRHLSYVMENRVPTQDGDGAAIVFAVSEGEVHSHQKSNLVLCGGGV